MCGIIGVLDWSGQHPPDVGLLRRMLGIIRHRGPDEFGLYVDGQAGIGCARLSIVDLSTGQQPIPNEDESLWIVFNGEVYNHPELRAELERAGHRFRTRSDTEVILHLYEDLGPECLHRLNGQFAIAIWDSRKEELFLARDRLGIRPLFYTLLPQGLLFGSEVKALLLDPRVEARIDPHGLAQTFTFWAPLAPRTIFQGILELPPGHYMQARADGCTLSRYWGLRFPEAGEEEPLPEEEAAEQLRDLLSDATRLRLRADVPVASYLSGGLDSTLIAALVRQHIPDTLCTFSIAFEDPAFDERPHQETATAFLSTDHRRTCCTNGDIGRVFPDVVWHAEAPLLRTSPAPMYLLSRLVRENHTKVVLTGEGADEFLGGYNLYKEDKVRRFWARQPDSPWRPLLLRRLYPYVADLSRSGDAYLAAFFRPGLTAVDRAGYSHHIRWRNTTRLQRLFSPALRATVGGYDPVQEFLATLDGMLPRWSPLAQAQYIEVATFMSPYLLSSQGDRMMAANSVEGRFPFLDHRVVAFCGRLPPHLKIRGLQEKYLLRKSARELLPAEIWRRRKQPYRAPIHPAFFARPLDYVEALLSPGALRAAGYFNPQAVNRLVKKCRAGARVSEGEDIALVGVLSTQLLHHLFVEHFPPRPVQPVDPLRVCRGER
ncbi:MAG TPA: asparagine synthase (glutamine-hydrolyzing) [Anaerolineales bacterium]|nr:asparagine synthase (glutamine-hydrolyzing) [Anaerolineae bacterium]HIQ01480.1 asparagine synthase (glutamine-hydrolyzing) [Anaerolineales bacterium]